MILETIIGALVPVGIDGIKSLIGMVTGGVKPISVDEVRPKRNKQATSHCTVR
jgi:hypothetical protein